ncbi:MAG: diguanylate cyclase [Chromatiales bacterium]|nr:diguanylate cyclase [Chromatiales bacterium]
MESKLKVLIIEPSRLFRELLKSLFETKGLDVAMVESTQAGMELLHQQQFDLICLSHQLDEKDALEYCDEIRSIPKMMLVPIIMLIADSNKSVINDALRAGLTDIFVKSDIEPLERFIDDLVKREMSYSKLKGRVLYAEDSRSIAQQTISYLNEIGLEVDHFLSGEETIEQFKKRDYDLVITDMILQGEMNGLTLVRKKNEIDKGSIHIPILAVTGIDDKARMVELLRSGVDDYVIKPVIMEELLARVRHLISIKQLSDKVEEQREIVDQYVITSTTDPYGNITAVSKAFCDISGFSEKDLLGRSHNIVRHPDMPKSLYEDLWSTIKEGRVWQGEVKNRSKDGTDYWVKAIITPNIKEGEITGYTAIRHDITDKKRAELLSISDEMTKLYNRRHFNTVFSQELSRARRNKQTLFFTMMDVDHFKQYNDTYGHQLGDNVLIEIGATLNGVLERGSDFAFRLGGEEFGIIFSDTPAEHAEGFIESVRTKIEGLNIKHENNSASDYVTISMGMVIISPEQEHDEDQLYKVADDALYQAKENGRNCLIVVNH